MATILFLELNGEVDRAADADLIHLALDAAQGVLDSDGIALRLKELFEAV